MISRPRPARAGFFPRRAARAWGCLSAWALLGWPAAASASGVLEPHPRIVRALDTRPDKGNERRYAYVTGPRAGIARLYNGDLEISFWNRPAEMTFSLAKNDVWDRRYFGWRKRVITIDDVRRRCFSVPPPKDGRYPGYGGLVGRNSDLGIPNAPQALYLAYDFPCPKPVGQVILRWPGLETFDRYDAGWARDGSLIARARRGGVRAELRAVLRRTRNLLVVRAQGVAGAGPAQVQLFRHKDTTPQGTSVAALANRGGKTGYDYSQDPDNGPLDPPQAGADGRFFWIRQKFPPDPTFPRGFEYVMMAALAGAEYRTAARDRVRGAGAQAVIHPVSPDTYRRLPGWLKEARLAAERVNRAEFGALAAASLAPGTKRFDLFVAVVTTRDAADPFAAARAQLAAALREGLETIILRNAAESDAAERAWRLSRVPHYNATSCTFADSTPWHGDYHFNEGYFLPTIVAGRPWSLEPRLRMFESMRPALERHAREVHRCRGLCFTLVHYPIKPLRVVYTNVTWEWGIENTAFMLQPFWQIFQYTQDKEFLRTRAYPMMREAARFYADYVKLGPDGRYHVEPTVSQEHWGFTPHFRLNRDSVGALSFIKYHLRACIAASRILGVDAQERERWRGIVERLAPYPTLDTPQGPVFCDVRGAPRLLNYNITANLVMVLWAEDISLDSPPDLLETARRSYRAIPDKEHSPRKGYLTRIRLYLGMLRKPWLCPQGRVLSWPGRIHLYAGVPPGASVNDRFSGLLAVGGFEVSAARAGRRVQQVRIRSRAGRVCKVKNPWPGEPVRVVEWPSRVSVDAAMEDDTLVFQTRAGRTYALLAGPELALADMRFEPKEEIVGEWTFDREERGAAPGRVGPAARLMGGAAIADEAGARALKLAGPSSYARVEPAPAFDFAANESFSVEARFNALADPAVEKIPLVCRMASKQYCLMLIAGKPRFYLSSPDGRTYAFADAKSFLADGRWHTVRGVRDAASDEIRVYVDGRLEGAAPDATRGDFASDAALAIGAYLWGPHTRFGRGLIDRVVVKRLGRLAPGRP